MDRPREVPLEVLHEAALYGGEEKANNPPPKGQAERGALFGYSPLRDGFNALPCGFHLLGAHYAPQVAKARAARTQVSVAVQR